MENKWPEKFDIVVANPPYSKKLHLKFLDKAFDVAKEQVIFVHPSTSFIDNKGKTNLFEKINAKILPHLKSIKLFNGNGFFGTALYVPFSITHINKKEKSKDFLVENEFSGIKYKTKDFHGIPVEWSITKENYQKLISKIKSISEKKNLHSEGNVLGSRQEHKRVLSLDNPFVVQFTHIRGSTKKNVKGWNSNLYEDDFFTIFRKTIEIERNPDIRYNIWFEFETQGEAENFVCFCKSSFARFCLSIFKISQNLHSGELKTIPWLDFTQEWTDEKLYTHFNITEEEQAFIKEVIPPYYD